MSASRARTTVWVVGAIGYGLDVITKVLALRLLDPDRPIDVIAGLLTLRLVHNPGAAFSLGENATILFTAVSIAALGVIVGWLVPRLRHVGWAVVAGLLVAGTAGNLTDRLTRPPGAFLGRVVDFIQIPFFAVFNVADICITAAAVGMLYLTLVARIDFAGESDRVTARDEASRG